MEGFQHVCEGISYRDCCQCFQEQHLVREPRVVLWIIREPRPVKRVKRLPAALYPFGRVFINQWYRPRGVLIRAPNIELPLPLRLESFALLS